MFRATAYFIDRIDPNNTGIISVHAYWYTEPTRAAASELFEPWRIAQNYENLLSNASIIITEVPDDV